jgi:phosphoenolpyruvate carboxykinase (ATP)
MLAMSVSTIPEAPLMALGEMGLHNSQPVHYQLSAQELTEQTLKRNEGVLNNTGALVIKTGKFTGRSPKDKFTVKDELTVDTVDWNDFNIPIEEKYFFKIKDKMLRYLSDKELWVRDCFACADVKYRLNLRVINESPANNLFCYNMFIKPTEKELVNFTPHWHIIQAPGFKANPAEDGTREENFAILSFKHKTILIGGSGYTGEMKKGIFTMLNFVLPVRANVLSMHCSANMGCEGDTAIFFGLSGTGKTTLSADPNRKLIGDDEHGWTEDGVFNFEGGCYAKAIDLSEEKEPEIFNAIKPGALVENTVFLPGSQTIDFSSKAITENTRVSYPLSFISNALEPSIGKTPQNIFFLTCDAYGILPPISKLTPGQAMYQFISGYTAKVAGTEAGITEPKATFSACFGAPFLPLHPGKYAEMLGNKMRETNVNVWMINTGWSGGPYGVGNRMKLSYTRSMITAALKGELENVEFVAHRTFGMMMPKECPNVPSALLSPRHAWADEHEYDLKAKELGKMFIQNFEKYKAGVSQEILAAAPTV